MSAPFQAGLASATVPVNAPSQTTGAGEEQEDLVQAPDKYINFNDYYDAIDLWAQESYAPSVRRPRQRQLRTPRRAHPVQHRAWLHPKLRLMELKLFASSLYLRSLAEYNELCDFLGLLYSRAEESHQGRSSSTCQRSKDILP